LIKVKNKRAPTRTCSQWENEQPSKNNIIAISNLLKA